MNKPLFLLLISFSLVLPKAFAASSPSQPREGPGGSDYKHLSVLKQSFGRGAEQFWIYQPAEPTPSSAPLIVFNHGWSGTNPKTYGAWIKHIVRKGNIVVFPVYQEPGRYRYPPDQVTANALKSVKGAIKELEAGDNIKPDLKRFAIVGHSAGGVITANMAALAKGEGLPEPSAVMVVEPGRTWKRLGVLPGLPLADLSKIPPNTLLAVIVGEDDSVVRDLDAKRIYQESSSIPPKNKELMVVRSDDHGTPPLKANHFFPLAFDPWFDAGKEEDLKESEENLDDTNDDLSVNKPKFWEQINALDYFGLWKTFDALCDAAFYGKNREYVLGNTPAQRNMGKWSDGKDVKGIEVVMLEHTILSRHVQE